MNREVKVGDTIEIIGIQSTVDIRGAIVTVERLDSSGDPGVVLPVNNEGSKPYEGCVWYYEEDNYIILPNKQTNNIKGEDKMGKTVIDADVKAEFGKEDGDTLININDHIESGVVRRVVMQKFHKEIVAECNHLEAKRIKDLEKD